MEHSPGKETFIFGIKYNKISFDLEFQMWSRAGWWHVAIRCYLPQPRGRDAVSTELFSGKQKEGNGIKAAGTHPWAAQRQRMFWVVARMMVDRNPLCGPPALVRSGGLSQPASLMILVPAELCKWLFIASLARSSAGTSAENSEIPWRRKVVSSWIFLFAKK